MRKHVIKRTPSVAGKSFNKEFMGAFHRFNQLSQQKIVVMWLYQQTYHQLRQKGTETGQNEAKLSDFWDSTEQDDRVI